jgi:hypothetical protein
MVEDDPEIEKSPLSCEVTRDGITVKVQIYRIKGAAEGWVLEVVDQTDASTVWHDPFASDKEAFAEFSKTLETEGIGTFFSEKPATSTLH